MATVRQISELVTTQLRDRVDRLVSAVEDDAADLADVADLARDIGEVAGKIDDIYRDLDEMLTRGLEGKALSDSLQEAGDSQQSGSSADDLTKEDLLERARDANIQGRSSMSKEELAEAVDAEENQTKDELLERARVADIEGRSSMTKDELRKALHDAGA